MLLHGEKPALTAGIQRVGLPVRRRRGSCVLRAGRQRTGRQGLPTGQRHGPPAEGLHRGAARRPSTALPLGLGEVPYGPLQVMHLQADTSALQEDTGWRPATPFEEGIRETIEWVRKETK